MDAFGAVAGLCRQQKRSTYCPKEKLGNQPWRPLASNRSLRMQIGPDIDTSATTRLAEEKVHCSHFAQAFDGLCKLLHASATRCC